MIDRFLLALPNGPRCDARDLDAGLSALARNQDLVFVPTKISVSLLVSPSLCEKLQCTDDGLLFGERYDRGTGRIVDPVAEQLEFNGDWPKSLASSGWGSYLALAQDSTGAFKIFRSECGSLPCYFMIRRNHVWLASHVRDLVPLSGAPMSFDWRAVSRHLTTPSYRSPQTCLAGIRELLPGYSLHLRGNQSEERCVWSPFDHVAPNPLATRADSIERVRRAVVQSVRSLSSARKHVLLTVSGGLDSSIVAACLRGAGVPTTLITFVTKDPRGDERGYAEELAHHLGLGLKTVWRDVLSVDVTKSSSAHLPRPLARSFAQSGDAACQAEARAIGADAHFNGGGGDNVFCYLQSSAPVADALLVLGFRDGLRTAIDMSQITGVSLPVALTKGIRRALRERRGYRWPEDRSFLTREAVHMAAGVAGHPWVSAPPGILPGKASHVAVLLAIQNHLEGFDRERTLPVISPLMSRPVLEACLAVPTWDWCSGGVDRSIAREAFACDLPPVISGRVSKGSPGAHVAELFDANRHRIRDLLGDGLLRHSEIIDFPAIERCLADRSPAAGAHHVRIMSIMDVEAWLRCWA